MSVNTFSIQAGKNGANALFCSADGGPAAEIVPDVDNMQVLYGVDTDANLVIDTLPEALLACVAGAVGVACAAVYQPSSWESARPRAETLGLALQQINIMRDVAEDWRLGRVYLPQEELTSFGVSGQSHVTILIGGPLGLSPGLLGRADEAWSFGPITLPHALARVVLLEASLVGEEPYPLGRRERVVELAVRADVEAPHCRRRPQEPSLRDQGHLSLQGPQDRDIRACDLHQLFPGQAAGLLR